MTAQDFVEHNAELGLRSFAGASETTGDESWPADLEDVPGPFRFRDSWGRPMIGALVADTAVARRVVAEMRGIP